MVPFVRNVSKIHQLFRYWSNEAISEWFLSINGYIYQQEITSIRKTDFINLIVDETQDATVRKMLSICLRYAEKDTGTIREQLFKIEPVTDTFGEGNSSNCYQKNN